SVPGSAEALKRGGAADIEAQREPKTRINEKHPLISAARKENYWVFDKEKDNPDIVPTIGYISPDGRFTIDVSSSDLGGSHTGFLDAISEKNPLDTSEGWVRKSSPNAFEFGSNATAEAIREVERQIIVGSELQPYIGSRNMSASEWRASGGDIVVEGY